MSLFTNNLRAAAHSALEGLKTSAIAFTGQGRRTRSASTIHFCVSVHSFLFISTQPRRLTTWLSTSKNFFSPAQRLSVSYTHLRAHETGRNLVCRLLLETK